MEALCAVQSVHAFLLAPHKLSLDRWAPVDKIFQAASIQPVLIFMNWKHNFLSFHFHFSKQVSPKPGKQQGSEAGNERDSQAAWGQKNISKTTIFYCQSMFRTFTWCCEGSQVLWGKFSASPSRTGANKQENRCIIYIVYDKANCCEFSCLKEPWEASPSNELPLQLPPAFPAPHPFECRRWWAQPSKFETETWIKPLSGWSSDGLFPTWPHCTWQLQTLLRWCRPESSTGFLWLHLRQLWTENIIGASPAR